MWQVKQRYSSAINLKSTLRARSRGRVLKDIKSAERNQSEASAHEGRHFSLGNLVPRSTPLLLLCRFGFERVRLPLERVDHLILFFELLVGWRRLSRVRLAVLTRRTHLVEQAPRQVTARSGGRRR